MTNSNKIEIIFKNTVKLAKTNTLTYYDNKKKFQ